MERLTDSTTSTNASFLRYLMSLRRHEMAPVAWIVIFDASSRCATKSSSATAATQWLCGERERETHDSHLRLDAFVRDVHFERLAFRVLRDAKVEDLCGDNVRQSSVGQSVGHRTV